MAQEKLNTFQWTFDRQRATQLLAAPDNAYDWAERASKVADTLTSAANMIDDALNDYCCDQLLYDRPDGQNFEEVEAYIPQIFATADEVEQHLQKGQDMGLTLQEIGLLDSLYGYAPNDYPEPYLAAAREIWKAVAPHEPKEGQQKSAAEGKHFAIMMRDSYVLPIVKKYDLELDQFDLRPDPVGYIHSWLLRFYQGGDIYEDQEM